MFARRRFAVLKNLLEYAGLEPGRLQFSWISSAEASKFQQTVTEVTAAVKALGPSQFLRKNLAEVA